jgi:hypothetical protein
MLRALASPEQEEPLVSRRGDALRFDVRPFEVATLRVVFD